MSRVVGHPLARGGVWVVNEDVQLEGIAVFGDLVVLLLEEMRVVEVFFADSEN